MYQAIVQSLRYFLAPIYELHEIRQVPTALHSVTPGAKPTACTVKRYDQLLGLRENAGDQVTRVMSRSTGNIPPPSHRVGSTGDPAAMSRYTRRAPGPSHLIMGGVPAASLVLAHGQHADA